MMQGFLFLVLGCLHCIWTSEGAISANYKIINASLDMTASSVTLLNLPNASLVSFSVSLTTVQVDSCLAGYYSYDDAETCSACPAGKYSTAVTANSIYTCDSCETGKYSSTVGANSSATCLGCPSNTYSINVGGTDIGSCVVCPVNSFSYTASKTPLACICVPGYTGPNGGPCYLCNPDNNDGNVGIGGGGGMGFDYAGGGGMDFGGGGGGMIVGGVTFWCLFGQMNPCPMHSTAGQGAYSLSQCLCDPGYYGDTTMGGPDLTVCQVGLFNFLRLLFGFY
jgi:hypothetical protein